MAILDDTCPPGTSHRKDASESSQYQRDASGSLVGGGKQSDSSHQQPIFANVECYISLLCDQFRRLRMSSDDQGEFIHMLCDRFSGLCESSDDQEGVPDDMKNEFLSWLYEDYRCSEGITADGYCDWFIEHYLSIKKCFEQRTMNEDDEKNDCIFWLYQHYRFLRSCYGNPSLKKYFDWLYELFPFLRNGDADQCRLSVEVQMINWMFFIFLSSKNKCMNIKEFFDTVCHQFSTNFFSSDASAGSNTLQFTGNAKLFHWVHHQFAFTLTNYPLDQCFNWLFDQFPFLRSPIAEINACLTNRKCGLYNVKANCWFNAMIQAALPLINVLEESNFPASFSYAQRCIFSITEMLHLNMKPSKGMVEDAVVSVCDESEMCPGEQQDAAKFYRYSITRLLEHFGNSPFFFVRSEERCHVCDTNETEMLHHSICIELDHKHTNASLSAYLKLRLSEISINCRICGTAVKSIISELPEVFVVQLLRGTENGKVTSAITPDEKLTLVDVNATKVDYSLISAVAHEGALVRGGHFVTYLLDNKGVLKFDDEIVSRIEARKSLSKDGYMFFYVKSPYL